MPRQAPATGPRPLTSLAARTAAAAVAAATAAAAVRAAGAAKGGDGGGGGCGNGGDGGRGGDSGKGGGPGQQGEPGKPGTHGCTRFEDLPDKPKGKLTLADKVRIVMVVLHGPTTSAEAAKKYKMSAHEIIPGNGSTLPATGPR